MMKYAVMLMKDNNVINYNKIDAFVKKFRFTHCECAYVHNSAYEDKQRMDSLVHFYSAKSEYAKHYKQYQKTRAYVNDFLSYEC